MDDDDIAFAYNTNSDAKEAVVSDQDQKIVQDMIDDCPGECIHWK